MHPTWLKDLLSLLSGPGDSEDLPSPAASPEPVTDIDRPQPSPHTPFVKRQATLRYIGSDPSDPGIPTHATPPPSSPVTPARSLQQSPTLDYQDDSHMVALEDDTHVEARFRFLWDPRVGIAKAFDTTSGNVVQVSVVVEAISSFMHLEFEALPLEGARSTS